MTDEKRQTYFAYGSNMSPVQMAERCPESIPLGIASLEGYRFIINTREVATIVPEKGRMVIGVLWSIDDEHERTLDRCEGVSTDFYRRCFLTVRGENGEDIEALVYIAADSGEGPPREGYLEKILAGAEHFGLPDEYVEELRSWQR